MTDFKPTYDFDKLTGGIREFMEKLGFSMESKFIGEPGSDGKSYTIGNTGWSFVYGKDEHCKETMEMRYRHSGGTIIFDLNFDMPIGMWGIDMYDAQMGTEWNNCFHADDFGEYFFDLTMPSTEEGLVECMEDSLKSMDDENSTADARRQMAVLCGEARKILNDRRS